MKNSNHAVRDPIHEQARPPKIVSAFTVLSSWSQRISFVLSALFLTVIAVVLMSGVISRYLFNSSLVWTGEVSTYCFVWMMFLGMSMAFRDRAHMAFDLLLRNSPSGLRRWLDHLLYLFMAVFTVILLYYGWIMTMENMKRISPVLGFSLGFAYLSIPIGAGFMFIHLVGQWLQHKQGGGT